MAPFALALLTATKSRVMRIFFLYGSILGCLLITPNLAAQEFKSSMMSRDVGCSLIESGRLQDICSAFSSHMEWTWFGHSVVSPGWRVTWDTVAKVYCELKISKDDTGGLKTLEMHAQDWRLEGGANSLIRILENQDGKGREDESSIFNPKNSSYILKNKCSSH